jgi:hypothetical protein
MCGTRQSRAWENVLCSLFVCLLLATNTRYMPSLFSVLRTVDEFWYCDLEYFCLLFVDASSSSCNSGATLLLFVELSWFTESTVINSEDVEMFNVLYMLSC